MNKKIKENVLLIVSILIIILGVAIFFFPKVSNFVYEKGVESSKEEFLLNIAESGNEEKYNTDSNGNIDKSKEENKSNLNSLFKLLQEKNQELYEQEQEELVDPFSYEQSAIDLSKYGIKNNVIGYIQIPKIKIELPIILGANTKNMKKGAVHLTQTSYPIGGTNTNCVIAAHRGYLRALFFKNIDRLEKGDKIYIQNFKENLTYVVYDVQISDPNDTTNLAIKKGEDNLTLITCHPLNSNKLRYIVKAKRQE